MRVERYLAVGLLALITVTCGSASAQTAEATTVDAPSPQFEVAAIKPAKPGNGNHKWDGSTDRITIENYTLRQLICVAFGLKLETQVLGGPKWIDHEAFDIKAKIDDADVVKMRKMASKARYAERNLMLQALLEDRFDLKVAHSTRKLPVFALVIAKGGTKLTPNPKQNNRSSDLSGDNGRITAANISMDEFVNDLETLDEVGSRVVLNRTGLRGTYDFKMNFTHDYGHGVPPDAHYPGLFTALKEQLGLELKPEKAPVPVVIVESAKEPELD